MSRDEGGLRSLHSLVGLGLVGMQLAIIQRLLLFGLCQFQCFLRLESYMKQLNVGGIIRRIPNREWCVHDTSLL